MDGRKEIAIAKSRKAYLEAIVLLSGDGKQMTCAAGPFDLLSWDGASCAFAAAHCSTKADAEMTVRELSGDKRHTSMLCSQFFYWHGTIAQRKIFAFYLPLFGIGSCNRKALSS